jgi:hypothetical protein
MQTFAVFHSTIQVCHRCNHFSHGNIKCTGVRGFMLNNCFHFKVNDSILDQNVPFIVLDLIVYGQRLTLVCLYGYNDDKPGLLSAYSGTFNITMTKYPFTLLPLSSSHLTSMSDLVFVTLNML